MFGSSKFKFTVFTILVAMGSSQMARAGDDSRIYTKSEQLASGRMAFSACFHVASIAKDRCERVGSARGYSEDELHRSAERLLKDAQWSRDNAKPLAMSTLVGMTVAGTIGAGILRALNVKPLLALPKSEALSAGGTVGIFAGLASAGTICWHLTSQADDLDMRQGALGAGKSTQDFDFGAYKSKLESTLSLGRLDSPRASPHLSDSLLKDLEESPAETSVVSAGSAATAAQ